MEVNSRCGYLNIYGGAPKKIKYCYTSAGIPYRFFPSLRHIFLPPRESRNISFHLCEIPVIPIPVQVSNRDPRGMGTFERDMGWAGPLYVPHECIARRSPMCLTSARGGRIQDGDAAFCQITLDTCLLLLRRRPAVQPVGGCGRQRGLACSSERAARHGTARRRSITVITRRRHARDSSSSSSSTTVAKTTTTETPTTGWRKKSP